MKKYLIPKLIGLAFLTMIALVLISFVEVAIYSYLIHPGETASFYDAHAELTAPYISGIFGFIAFFLVSRYWKKKQYENAFALSLYFPLTYVLLDIVLITAMAADQWGSFWLIFLVANAAKFAGSYAGNKV